MKAKKHLRFISLRKMISDQIRLWQDHRRQKSTSHSVHDAVMSGLACMFFQEPSLLQFQQGYIKDTHILYTLIANPAKLHSTKKSIGTNL